MLIVDIYSGSEEAAAFSTPMLATPMPQGSSGYHQN